MNKRNQGQTKDKEEIKTNEELLLLADSRWSSVKAANQVTPVSLVEQRPGGNVAVVDRFCR